MAHSSDANCQTQNEDIIIRKTIDELKDQRRVALEHALHVREAFYKHVQYCEEEIEIRIESLKIAVDIAVDEFLSHVSAIENIEKNNSNSDIISSYEKMHQMVSKQNKESQNHYWPSIGDFYSYRPKHNELSIALEHRQLDDIEYHLDISCDDHRRQVLCEASGSGFLPAVRLLVNKYDIKVNYLNSLDMTPLMMACLDGQKDVVAFLLRKGAKVERLKSGRREPCLMIARANGNLEIVDLLLRHKE